MSIDVKPSKTVQKNQIQLYQELFGFLTLLSIMAASYPKEATDYGQEAAVKAKISEPPIDVLAREHPFLYALHTCF